MTKKEIKDKNLELLRKGIALNKKRDSGSLSTEKYIKAIRSLTVEFSDFVDELAEEWR